MAIFGVARELLENRQRLALLCVGLTLVCGGLFVFWWDYTTTHWYFSVGGQFRMPPPERQYDFPSWCGGAAICGMGMVLVSLYKSVYAFNSRNLDDGSTGMESWLEERF